MKALTLRPHWAWLVVNGYNDIENRSRRTHHRGKLWIHAGSRPVTQAEYDLFVDVCRKRRIKDYPARTDFPLGGIVGSVEITDCVDSSRSYWFNGSGFGYVLKNARKARFRPIKGQLGLFEVNSKATK